MRSTIWFAVLALVLPVVSSAVDEQRDDAASRYVVELMLTNRTTNKESKTTAQIVTGKAQQLRDTRFRPFVTGLRTTTTGNEPLIQEVEEGLVADVKVVGIGKDAITLDATFEISEIVDVRTKRYPGTELFVQCVDIKADKSRVIEMVKLGENLTAKLKIDDNKYDIVLTVKTASSK